MIKRMLCLSLTLSATVAVAQTGPQTAAKLDMAKAKQTAEQVCAACHGADGNSVITANPSLAGQHASYIYKQLHNFKGWEGKQPERPNAVMTAMATPLSDDDMKALAAYFSQQKAKPAVAHNKDTLDLGRRLWRGGDQARGLPACAGCHGPAGAGLPSQFPRLAGQHPEYTEAQLKAFRDVTDASKPDSPHVRANDPNSMMRSIALRMTDPEIKAVADYIAGLR
ncbi:MAG: c-type cytochrome [Rhodocyclaceae bacterium]